MTLVTAQPLEVSHGYGQASYKPKRKRALVAASFWATQFTAIASWQVPVIQFTFSVR